MAETTLRIDERTAWREWRRRGIGGSDAPALAGVHPFKSAVAVWLEKTGRLMPQDDEDEPQRWGHLLEDAVVREFEQRAELGVADRQAMVEARPPLPGFMRATVDGRIMDAGFRHDPLWALGLHDPLGLYEGKTASRRGWEWDDGVPRHVVVQVQHNLAVTGLDHAWVACLLLVPVPRLKLYELDRDDELIEILVGIERRFWEHNVLGDVMPAIDASEATGDALREAYRDGAGGTVDLEPALVAARMAAKAEVDEAEGRLSLADNAIMAALGVADLGRVDGRVAVTWKSQGRTSIDLEALRKARPEVAAAFGRKSTVRVLRFPALKEE